MDDQANDERFHNDLAALLTERVQQGTVSAIREYKVCAVRLEKANGNGA